MWSSIVCTLGRRGTQWEDSPERNRALSYTVLPLVSYASLLVAAILLPSQPVPALVCHRCGNVLLLFIGIRNAWDVVTYTAFERRLWIHRRRQPLTGSAKRLRSTTGYSGQISKRHYYFLQRR